VGIVSVTLLGGFAAAADGVPVPEKAWRLKKARELVKLLALAPGHRIHREQAMDLLWGERPPASAANNLHQAVHVARRALGAQAIEGRDELLFLVGEVDVDLFEHAAAGARRAGTPAAYRAALALYGGELLPENRYDDWAETRRVELAELAAELTEELTSFDGSDDERSRALPVDASSFVGRSRELGELAALLARTRMLTLTGTGGAGKTRLALELARGCESNYPDGAAIVELAALADGRLVPDAVAAALDVRALPTQEPLDAVSDFLARRTLLLVLDNCEHLLVAAATLADALLRSAPGLTIAATSREPLRIPGEVVFRVPSLDIPDPAHGLPAERLLDYEAVRLFADRATAAAPGFAVDAQNAADVARICFRLDGLPLALELAAGRLGALSPAAVAERLDDRFRLLRTGSHAAPTRQQTLEATLEWSHDLLETDERMLLRRLAVFAGGFELEAVEIVCPRDDLDVAGIADVLARLVEKSLVALEGSGSERRYRLLETVRLYAQARLQEADEVTELTDRHASWALALAELEREAPRLDRDAANLRAALDTLLERRPHDALRLCVALLPFWMRRIDLHDAKRRFGDALTGAPERTALRAEALLAAAAVDFRSGTLPRAMALAEESHAVAAGVGDARAEWRALQFLGELGVASDAADVAVPWIERALDLAGREGFVPEEAIGVYSLGVAHWMLGDLVGAEELVAQSIELFRTLVDSTRLIPSPVNIAEVASEPEGRAGLQLVFEDTLQPFVEISCAAAVSHALVNQAGIARARGELARARALLDESAARFENDGDERGRAAVLVRRAYIELGDGAAGPARADLESALELRRQLGDRRGVALVLAGLGFVDTVDGDYDSAEYHLQEARDIFGRAGDRWGLASTLWRTADLALARGDLDGAEAALLEARSVVDETQRERWIANTLSGLAEVAVLRGDLELASVFLADARERYAARHYALGVANVEERLRGLAKAPAKGARRGAG
jgi:predicted ATPase